MGKKISEERLKIMVNESYGGDFVLIEGDNGMSGQGVFTHKKCGNKFTKIVNKIVDEKEWCPYCSRGGLKKKTTEQAQAKLKERYGDKYTILSEYINATSYLKVRCNDCGNTFDTTFHTIYSKGICKQCAINRKTKTQEEFHNQVNTLSGGEYGLVSEYKNRKTHVEIKHNLCNTTFKILPLTIMGENYMFKCPKCSNSNDSKYSIKVQDILDEYGIEYIKEKTFEDCVGIKNKLPFDFYLPMYDTCIEVDGEQHFDSRSFGMSENRYKAIKSTDNIKTNYCRDNKITLIRLPYYNYNDFEKILITQLIPR